MLNFPFSARLPSRSRLIGVAKTGCGWPGIAVVATVIVLASFRGVLLAQEPLSAKERIARIEQARQAVEREQRQHLRQRQVEEERKRNKEKKAKEQKTEPKRIMFVGHVLTADGVALTETGSENHGTITWRHGVGSAVQSLGRDCDFKLGLPTGRKVPLTIIAQHPGYAPTVFGPLPLSSRDDWDDLEIRLRRGFPGKLKLRDPEGDLIRQATIDVRLSVPAKPPGRSPLAGQPQSLVTNNSGFTLEHATKHPYEVTVVAPGYERETFKKIKFQAGQITTLELTPTEPANGIVTDARGKPLADVKIKLGAIFEIVETTNPPQLRRRQRFSPTVPLTTTDERGRFALASLPSDMTSVVCFRSEGMELVLAGIRPGQRGIKIELGPERVLRGEVLGDLSQMRKAYFGREHPVPYLRYAISYFDEVEGLPDGLGGRTGGFVKIVPDPKSGNPPRRGTFEIQAIRTREGLPRGVYVFRLKERRVVVEPFDGVKNVTIDLTKRWSRAARKVRIRFVTPRKVAPPPRGVVEVRVVHYSENEEENWSRHMPVTLKNGVAELTARIGSRITLRNQGLIGYTFDNDRIGWVEVPRRGAKMPGFRVVKGAAPLVKEVAVTPAGAIHVNVPKWREATDGNVNRVQIECWRIDDGANPRPEIMGYYHHINEKFPSQSLLVTPVPFDGVYVLLIELNGLTVVTSEPVGVTPADPVPKLMIDLPKLTSARVRVVDAAGNPVVDERVYIKRKYPQRTRMTTSTTNFQGEVVFPLLEAGKLEEYQVYTADNQDEATTLGQGITVLHAESP